jgi:hypothetical protein
MHDIVISGGTNIEATGSRFVTGDEALAGEPIVSAGATAGPGHRHWQDTSVRLGRLARTGR